MPVSMYTASVPVFIKTLTGWKIAVTTAFGLPAGAPPQCK